MKKITVSSPGRRSWPQEIRAVNIAGLPEKRPKYGVLSWLEMGKVKFPATLSPQTSQPNRFNACYKQAAARASPSFCRV